MSFNNYDPCDDSVLLAGVFQTCFGSGSVDWGDIEHKAFISNSRTSDPWLATGSPTTKEEYYALFQDKANWLTLIKWLLHPLQDLQLYQVVMQKK